MFGERSSYILDRTLEEELRNPRVIGCSMIIKDNKPVYYHFYRADGATNLHRASLRSPRSMAGDAFMAEKDNSPMCSQNTISKCNKDKSDHEPISPNSRMFIAGDSSHLNSGKSLNTENETCNLRKKKKDFSIWRCLCWPEVAISPIHSSGYGRMRLSICLNKILSFSFSGKDVNYIDKEISSTGELEFLPYIRVYYNDELLFQSCVVHKNSCIILDIDVHHPLSNITIEIYDFDDSDLSLIGSFEDFISQITIPIGIHSNRKPLETQLVLGVDEETRLLFIRKSHQNKVQKDNLVAQKLMRFPITGIYDTSETENVKNVKEENMNKNKKNTGIIESENEMEDEFEILETTFEGKERYNHQTSNGPSNGIYYEILNKMVKDAIELSVNAENKYRKTGRLQSPYSTFVVQVYSEIRWSRLSVIPREIFALYLPEPKITKPRSSTTKDLRLEGDIRTLINAIIVLRELFSSDCFIPVKDKIWKLHNWDSYALSFFAFGVIWYTLFHPEYIYSLFFSLSLYILVNNFNRKDKFVKLESLILGKLRPSQRYGSNINLDLDLDLNSEIRSQNHDAPYQVNQEGCTFESERCSKDKKNDFAILETLLTSSVFSQDSLYYIQNISILAEGLARYTVKVMRLLHWYDFLKSLFLTSLFCILLIISLIYSNSLYKITQYVFLFSLLFSSSYFLPPIKGIFRLIRSYRKYMRLKKKSSYLSGRSDDA